MAKYKLEVLKHTRGQGGDAFLEAGVIDDPEKALGETPVIFRLDAKDLDRFPQPDIEGFSARRIKSWQELDGKKRARFTKAQEQEGIWWGDIDWFESGRVGWADARLR